MPRLLLLGGLLALGATGCLNPDDIFPVTGSLASPDPVAGRTVRLLRTPHRSQYGSCDGTGLQPFKEAAVDADGGYQLEVFRAQALSLTTGLGAGFCMRVAAGFDSGTEASSDLIVYGPTLLGPFRDWRPAMRLDGGVVAFEPPIPWPDEAVVLDGGLAAQLDHQLRAVTGDGGLAWKAADRLVSSGLDDPGGRGLVRRPLLVDPLRLEDFAGTLQLQASVLEVVPDQSPLLPAFYFSNPVSLRAGERLPFAGSRVPFSRGLPCPALGSPCPLTDGALTVEDLEATEVALAWSPPRVVTAMVLRGVESDSDLLDLELGLPDGGVVGPLTYALPWSEADRMFQNPELLPDGGFVTQPLLRHLFGVLAVDAGEPATGAVLRFRGGLRRAAEVSLFE